MADPLTKGVVSVAAGLTGVVVIPDILGVSVLVVLSAFVGAAAILSFLPAVHPVRMLGTVIFCASAGIGGGSIVARNVEVLRGADALTALGIAALLQLAIPLAVEHRGAIAERLLSLIGLKKGGR